MLINGRKSDDEEHNGEQNLKGTLTLKLFPTPTQAVSLHSLPSLIVESIAKPFISNLISLNKFR